MILSVMLTSSIHGLLWKVKCERKVKTKQCALQKQTNKQTNQQTNKQTNVKITPHKFCRFYPNINKGPVLLNHCIYRFTEKKTTKQTRLQND